MSTSPLRWPQYLAAFAVALFVTHCLASLSQSFFTLQALRSIGVELHWRDWLITIGRDLYGLAFRGAKVPYAAMLLAALAIALPMAGWIRRRIGGDWLYAPSGLAQCRDCRWPAWEEDVFLGGLAGRQVRRMQIDDGRVIGEEILFAELKERIRDVRFAADGSLYLLTDNRQSARLLRVVPDGQADLHE